MAPKEKKERAPRVRKNKDKDGRASPASETSDETLANGIEKLGLEDDAGNRTSAGVLTSHRDSRDIKIEQVIF